MDEHAVLLGVTFFIILLFSLLFFKSFYCYWIGTAFSFFNLFIAIGI